MEHLEIFGVSHNLELAGVYRFFFLPNMLVSHADAVNICGDFFWLSDDASSSLVSVDNIQLQNFKALEGQIVQLELLACYLLH